MKHDELFSAENDTIELDGIDSLIMFTRFNPSNPDKFLKGLELVEDLKTDTGAILYTQGTEISAERIERLLQIRKSNPKVAMVFKIKRSAKLIQTFRDEICGRLMELFERRKGTRAFRKLMAGIDQDIESSVTQILADESTILAIYKVKFLCESVKEKRSFLFLDHAINVAIFSAAVASSEPYSAVVGGDKAKLLEIVKAALFHNYGSLLQIDSVLEAPADKRFDRYWEANRNGYFSLGSLQLSSEIMDAIRNLCEYYAGRKDFITSQEWPATMANIMLVVDAFLQAESDLFKEPQPVRLVVDNLNLKLMENEYNALAVKALTLGLNLQDIFDFYLEMDKLVKECVKDDETAFPFPMTGFQSPTIFVCRKNVADCPHFEGSLKAVNLLKKMGDLQPGKYHRCKFLTPRILRFYKKHYEAIKDTISDQKES